MSIYAREKMYNNMMYLDCSGNSRNKKPSLSASEPNTNIFLAILIIVSKIASFFKLLNSAKKGKIKPIEEVSIPFVESEVLLLYKRTYKFQVNGLMPTAAKHRQYIETILSHFAEIIPLKRDSEASFIIIQGACDAEQLCQIELIIEEIAEQLDEGDYIVTTEPSDFYNDN